VHVHGELLLATEICVLVRRAIELQSRLPMKLHGPVKIAIRKWQSLADESHMQSNAASVQAMDSPDRPTKICGCRAGAAKI
jgi:hypothetical protein